jgi:hypothetical protein
MAKVDFTSFYLGPVAVYTSPTGLTDPITGLSEKGGNFAVGNYCDVTETEAKQWNVAYGTNLHQGRYRIVKLSTVATTGNTGLGKPLGWGLGTTVAQVAISVAGTSATSDGTYTVASTVSGGSAKATAQVVVSGGVMISAKLLNSGAGFTSVPTFGLTEIAGLVGSPSLLAQMDDSSNFVTTFDSSAISLYLVRGISLCTVTAAQITAGAYIVIQELGIAPVYVTTATATAPGANCAAATAAAVTTTTPTTSVVIASFGYTLDTVAAATTVRCVLTLPVLQG